jgi:hypothetical protein
MTRQVFGSRFIRESISLSQALDSLANWNELCIQDRLVRTIQVGRLHLPAPGLYLEHKGQE